MVFKTTLTALLLPALGFAAPAMTSTAATATGPAPQCLYTSLPGYNVYAASMPNPHLNTDTIDNFYENFSFACSVGDEFTARILAQSTLNPKPWFGAIEYSTQQNSQCTPDNFATIVSSAMQWQNPNANYQAVCRPFTGQKANAFQRAAGQYFASLA